MAYFKLLTAVVPAIVLLPSLAIAQTSNFGRDRVVSVAERMPNEYRPLGVRLGAFMLSPKIELGAATNDNIFYTESNTVSDTLLSVSPSANLTSNWSRHALSASLSAEYDTYAKYSDQNTTQWTAGAAGRLDIQRNSNLFASASYGQRYEALYNPSTPRSAAAPVKYDSTDLRGGFLFERNRIRLTGSLTYSKLNFYDVESLSGTILDQDARDFATKGFSARVDYAISPSVAVYGSYSGNNRDYSQSAVNRNSDGYAAAIGTSFEITTLMRGEIELGHLEQTYKNAAFPDANGSFINGRVEYFPTELMTVTLSSRRTIQETPDFGVSGFLSTDTNIRVDYELLRPLLLHASYGSITDDYQGEDRNDHRTAFELGGRYMMSRRLAVKAQYQFSKNESKGVAGIPGYSDNLFMISLALQY